MFWWRARYISLIVTTYLPVYRVLWQIILVDVYSRWCVFRGGTLVTVEGTNLDSVAEPHISIDVRVTGVINGGSVTEPSSEVTRLY